MQNNLLLIYPHQKKSVVFGDSVSYNMPPMGLAYIAAVTPKEWNVKIIDETVQTTDFQYHADLVGINVLTVNTNRAYKLSAEYKKRGVPVVLGGPHVTIMPDEASQYADSIVLGEGEGVWPIVLNDVKNNQLKKVYKGEHINLDNLVHPRRDLLSDKYEMDVIQTTRGCPFQCDFCLIPKIGGMKYRQRPVEDVINEFKTLKKKVVYFLDDNFFGGFSGKDRAIAFCKALIENKIKKIWMTQTSVNTGLDDDVLKLAYKSGCRGLLLGLESVSEETLKRVNKSANLKLGEAGIKKAIERIHSHGIIVVGSFLFGNDGDDITIFKRTLDFIDKMGLDSINLNTLTPYPGTKIYERLKKEGRLIYHDYPKNWSLYDEQNVLFTPDRMSVNELVQGIDYIVSKYLNAFAVIKNFIKTLMRTKCLTSAVVAYVSNKSMDDVYNRYNRYKNIG